MDEVQAVTSRLKHAFRSATVMDENTGELRCRSLFRAILVNVMQRTATRPSVFVVPTGTNVSHTDFDENVLSAGQRGNCVPQSVRFTGGLTTIDALEAYTRRYLPAEYLRSESGKRLLQRILTWLPGRYRFTAQYIFYLMGNGLRSPHRLLNSFVYAYTEGYVPTDAEDLIAQEPEYPLEGIKTSGNHVDLVNMKALDADPDRRLTVLGVIRPMVHSYLLRTAADMVLSPDDSPILVEVGFGHYASLAQLSGKPLRDRQPQRAEINEPLMILRLATHLGKNVLHAAYDYFARAVGSSTTRNNSDGWENFLAHCLLQIFSDKPVLSSVFNIVDEQVSDFAELMSCRAELVGVVRANETHVVGPVRDGRRPNQHIPPVYQPSVTLGVSTASVNDDAAKGERNKQKLERTLDWLKKTPTPFLFPDTNMGPDLIAILHLNDEELCWLLLQAKLLTPEYRVETDTYVVKGNSVKNGIWSVTPECLYLSRSTYEKKQAQSEASLQNNADTLAELKKLPNRTALAGEHSVLRAIAIFPGALRLADYAEQADLYKASPLVELDFDRFRATFDQAEPRNIMGILEMTKQRFARDDHERKEKGKQKAERTKSAQHNRPLVAQHPPVQTGQKVDPVPKGHVRPRKDKIARASGKASGTGKKKRHTGRAPVVVPRSAGDDDAMDELNVADLDGGDLYQDLGPDVGSPDTATVVSGQSSSNDSLTLLSAAGSSHQPYPLSLNASTSLAALSSSVAPPAVHRHSYSDSSVSGASTLVPPSHAYSYSSSESVMTKRMVEQMDSDSDDDDDDGLYDVTGSPWKKPKYFN